MTGPLTRITSVPQANGIVIYSASNVGFYYLPTDIFLEYIRETIVPNEVLLQYVQDNIVFPTDASDYVTQYSAPSSTGFNVSITPASDQDVHLILTPTAGFADGTITLPPVAGCRDGQRVLVNCTQQVTTLVIAPNGATAVTGEPTTLGADDYFTLMFDLPTLTWYRVG